MKKFLSLLLAMTMVMSLVVVPARAATTPGQITGDISIKNGADSVTSAISLKKDDDAKKSVTLTADTDELVLKNSEGGDLTSGASKEYTWSTSSNAVTISYTNNSCTITANTSGIATVTCSVKMSKTDVDNTVEATKTATVTINSSDPDGDANTAFGNAITLTYDNRPCTLSKGVYTGYKFETEGQWKATVPENSGFTVTDGDNLTVSNNTVTVNGKRTAGNKNVTVTFNVKVEDASVTVTTTPTDATILSGGYVRLTAEAKGFTDAQYVWYEAKGSGKFEPVRGATSSTLGVELTNNTKENVTYKYKCKVTNGAEGAPSVTSDPVTVTVKPAGEYDLFVNVVKPENTSGNSIMLTPASSKAVFSTELKVKADNEYNSVEGASYRYDVTGNESAFNITGKDSSTLNVTLRSGRSGSITVTPTATYMGLTVYGTPKTYTISSNTLSATLATSVQNGGYVSLTSAYSNSYTSLAYIAQNVLRSKVKNDLTVASATIKEAPVAAATAPVIGGTISKLSNGYYTFTAATGSLTPGQLTIVAKASDNNTYEIKLTIPVTPIATNFESVVAEPVTTTVNTSYKVYFPATHTRYYVINKTGIAPSSWSSAMLGTPYSATTPYPLSASDFNNATGTCTLYVVAQSSSGLTYGNYYCGPMTVTQTNYNINYNGVAGETVQFKHTDFTNFMNEVSQARGDSSKTSSYPYVTFSYVTFDYPYTAQGTLYYNGTAMSNSSYSGSFNSRTQITNLDAITFVPNAKTSAKTVAVTFTLHAVKYGTNGTVVNRDLTYKGTVNISLVREDIKYTVAPGDAITFTDSDFLNYLRAQSGINFNYNVDYVTFDQSAVNVASEGVLYSGYAGYNQVKTTDKFYYSATNYYTQNALSDVTFRASLYAKTGTTVYIPFTIYAKYGTSSAATRQVTGTVAVKIAQTMNFVDVKPADYFYNPVKWAVTKNITKGTSATTFSPDKTCTRAEIVTFLWRDAGSPMPTISRHPFTDVSYSMGADFYNAILWASQNGITAGTSTTTFSPNKNCTRAEIVTFLWRYAKKPVGYGSNSFTDVNKNDHAPYYDAILWAVSKGITTGSTTTTFAPNDTCTRAQAVTFLYRYEGGK